MKNQTENKPKTGKGREYVLACKKKFQVRYGYKGGKWQFRIGDFTLMTKVATGKDGADRIAELLRQSWFRSEQIDGTCRNAINKIANADFKALKDYRGPYDHNWSWKDRRSVTDTIVTHAVEITGEVVTETDAVAA